MPRSNTAGLRVLAPCRSSPVPVVQLRICCKCSAQARWLVNNSAMLQFGQRQRNALAVRTSGHHRNMVSQYQQRSWQLDWLSLLDLRDSVFEQGDVLAPDGHEQCGLDRSG